jgi:hypothetical protein
MEKLTQIVVEEWVKGTTGQFSLTNIYNELGMLTPESKSHIRVIMHRLTEQGIVVALGKRDGLYRLVEDEAPKINWRGADKMSVPLRFPFELEKFIRILPKSLIILAGSSGAGKTALLYNIVYMNMNDFEIHLFSNSEMGEMQIEERFNAIDPDIPDPLPFETWRREDNFADVIKPDAINVIDYLDLDNEVFLIGYELKKIIQKLNEGVAIVAIQKPPGRDLGYGAGYSVKSASLYLSMDGPKGKGPGKLKIVKARERAISDVDPLNKTWGFRLDNRGANFIDISEEVKR